MINKIELFIYLVFFIINSTMRNQTILLLLCFQLTHCSLKLFTFKKHINRGKEHPIIVVNHKMIEVVKCDNITFKGNNNDTSGFSLTCWPRRPISPLDLSLLLMV